MRWGYKTIHFGLKKDGLLGSGFLDETEIEQSLNEYGRGGWELVSMMEVSDGLIAVFKQPLSPPATSLDESAAPGETKTEGTPVPTTVEHVQKDGGEEREPLADTDEKSEGVSGEDDDTDVGSIRIF